MGEKKKVLITIAGLSFHGNVRVKVGDSISLRTEDNEHDTEAIAIFTSDNGKIGYVANSVETRAKGTHSAGYIYDAVKTSFSTIGKIIIIGGQCVIAEVEV